MDSENRPVQRHRGRPPLFGPNEPRPMTRVHLNMTQNVWKGLENYMRDMEEVSLSGAARRIISDKLVEMGYLKRDRAPYASQNSTTTTR